MRVDNAENMQKKHLLTYVLFFILAGVSLYAITYRKEIISPCLPPLSYSIGTVDPRFGISKEDFLFIVKQSERLWEEKLNENVFVFDPKASFTIQLVYDERQSKTQKGTRLESEIKAEKESYEKINKTLDTSSETYETLLAEYTKLSKEYEKELKEYNDAVVFWNEQGGAPEKEYEKLQKERDALEKKRNEINNLANKVNAAAKNSNAIASNLNETAKTINNKIDEHNTLFENDPEFEKGIYERTNITIYQYTNRDDLLLTLTHEMGHALHIGYHLENPQSIMFPYIQDQSRNPITLTSEDITTAKHACRFDIDTPQEYKKLFLESLSALFN